MVGRTLLTIKLSTTVVEDSTVSSSETGFGTGLTTGLSSSADGRRQQAPYRKPSIQVPRTVPEIKKKYLHGCPVKLDN